MRSLKTFFIFGLAVLLLGFMVSCKKVKNPYSPDIPKIIEPDPNRIVTHRVVASMFIMMGTNDDVDGEFDFDVYSEDNQHLTTLHFNTDDVPIFSGGSVREKIKITSTLKGPASQTEWKVPIRVKLVSTTVENPVLEKITFIWSIFLLFTNEGWVLDYSDSLYERIHFDTNWLIGEEKTISFIIRKKSDS